MEPACPPTQQNLTYVVFLGSNTPTFPDLYGHGATDDIAGGQVLGRWRVPFHEAFAFAVAEQSTLPPTAFGHETPGT